MRCSCLVDNWLSLILMSHTNGEAGGDPEFQNKRLPSKLIMMEVFYRPTSSVQFYFISMWSGP